MLPKKINPYFAVITVAAIWGISTPVIKYALYFVSPFVFLTLRFLVSSFILYLLCVALQKNSLNLKKLGIKNFIYLFAFGLINGAIPLLFYFYGISLASSVETSIVVTMGPVLAIFMGFIFYKEKVSRRELIGLVITVFGFLVAILLPIFNEGFQQGSVNLIGILFLFLYMISNIFALLVIKHIMTGKEHSFSSLQLTFFTSFSSFLVIAPFGIYEILTSRYINYYPAMFGIFYMAILSSVLAYFLYNVSIAKLGVGETTLFTYLEPLFGIPLAIIFLQEAFSFFYVAGGVLVVLGLYVSEHISRTRKRNWSRK